MPNNKNNCIIIWMDRIAATAATVCLLTRALHYPQVQSIEWNFVIVFCTLRRQIVPFFDYIYTASYSERAFSPAAVQFCSPESEEPEPRPRLNRFVYFRLQLFKMRSFFCIEMLLVFVFASFFTNTCSDDSRQPQSSGRTIQMHVHTGNAHNKNTK